MNHYYQGIIFLKSPTICFLDNAQKIQFDILYDHTLQTLKNNEHLRVQSNNIRYMKQRLFYTCFIFGVPIICNVTFDFK